MKLADLPIECVMFMEPDEEAGWQPLRTTAQWKHLYRTRLGIYRQRAEQMKKRNYERWAKFTVLA